MNSVHNSVGVHSTPAQRSPAAGSAQQIGGGPLPAATDTYTHDCTQSPITKPKTTALTEDMAADFAKKYDVRNMDRNQYTRLLVNLRDAGVLTSQEYSAAYGGSMPSAAESIPWPQGRQTVDFTKLLQNCSQLCSASDSAGEASQNANDQTLSETYSHLSKIFSAIGAVTASSQKAPLTNEEQEVERLTALLKEDKAFCENPHRNFYNHPLAQKLVMAMILANERFLAQLATNFGVSIPQMKDMLNSEDGQTIAQVDLAYHNMLVSKAQSEGLTETETLLSGHLEWVNFIEQSSFDQRMESIKQDIDQALQEKGMNLDHSKSYSFSLDTSNFTFSVSGGTDEENAMISDIINSSENLVQSLSAMYGHKKEDGQMVSEAYTDKMSKLIPAYNQWSVENYMQERYGFGMDDIEYKGGYTIVGNTQEITDQINSMGSDFIIFGGGELLVNVDRVLRTKYGFGLHEVDFTGDEKLVGRTKEVQSLIAQGGADLYEDIKHPPKVDVPVFDNPVFTLENGQFKAVYE